MPKNRLPNTLRIRYSKNLITIFFFEEARANAPDIHNKATMEASTAYLG